MQSDPNQEGHAWKSTSSPGEKWRRRATSLAGSGMLIASLTLFGGIAKEPAASGSLVACRILVDRCCGSLMGDAQVDPAEAQQTQLREEFERSPLYAKIFHDVFRWLEEDRQLTYVQDTPDERQEVTGFLASRFLEIRDAAFIANLERNATARSLFEICRRHQIGEDRTTLVASYGMILTHYEAFIGLDMSHVREVFRKTRSIKQRMPIGVDSLEAENAGAQSNGILPEGAAGGCRENY